MATRFRTSFTHQEGLDPSYTIQGRVVGINMANYTVDVKSQFDRKFYPDIQVGTPYLHYNNGEGMWAFPEVGATCMITMPSDSSPPFVSSFIMPHEVVDTSAEDAPEGTSASHGQNAKYPNAACFSGGRPKGKPGDINLRTRDGNFVTLHRGGVLQIGANELSQRIYIPIQNVITDFSGRYNHHNLMGSITWGIQEGPEQVQVPGMFTQVFRIHADDKYADIRVRYGKVVAAPEPADGAQSDIDGIGISKEIIHEVVVAPGGFTEDGSSSGANNSVYRHFFAADGGSFLRCNGSILVVSRKKLTIKVREEFILNGESTGVLTFKDSLSINGGTFMDINADVIRINGGTMPLSGMGDIVTSSILANPVLPGLLCSTPTGVPLGIVTGFLNLTNVVTGTITSGRSNILGR